MKIVTQSGDTSREQRVDSQPVSASNKRRAARERAAGIGPMVYIYKSKSSFLVSRSLCSFPFCLRRSSKVRERRDFAAEKIGPREFSRGMRHSAKNSKFHRKSLPTSFEFFVVFQTVFVIFSLFFFFLFFLCFTVILFFDGVDLFHREYL